MAFNFNGNVPDVITFNGNNVAELQFNGVKVWPEQVGPKRLQYIESNVAQEATAFPYIDTGFCPDANKKYTIECTFYESDWRAAFNRNRYIAGVNDNADFKYCPFVHQTSYNMRICTQMEYGASTQPIYNVAAISDEFHTFKVVFDGYGNEFKGYIDNVYKSSTPLGNNRVYTLPIYLFALNDKGTANFPGALRMKEFKISLAGTDLLDLVAAKDGDKVGMYDTVSETFFENQGSVNFIAGPDL